MSPLIKEKGATLKGRMAHDLFTLLRVTVQHTFSLASAFGAMSDFTDFG